MIAFIAILVIYTITIFRLGYLAHKSQTNMHICGKAIIRPSEISDIYETQISIEDIPGLYNSKYAIFTVIHAHDKQ